MERPFNKFMPTRPVLSDEGSKKPRNRFEATPRPDESTPRPHNRFKDAPDTPAPVETDNRESHWVLVDRQFDWKPTRRSVVPFMPGHHFMTKAAADQLEAEGKGKRVDRPEDLKTDKRGKVVRRDD